MSDLADSKIDRPVWELALAGLLHDIGKLLQRGKSPEELRALKPELQVFCPKDQSGRATHHHAAFTAAFVEKHFAHLILQGQGDENILGWAARHHIPSSSRDWIVAEADRLSSGMDRGSRDETWSGWQNAIGRRLLPVLARVSPEGMRADPGELRFPLCSLELKRESFFPLRPDESNPQSASEQYAAVRGSFEGEVQRLITAPAASLHAAVETTQSILAVHTWSVPSATNEATADVSLYDHSRTAAAIAAAMIAQMAEEELAPEDRKTIDWVKKRDSKRYRLIYGDVSGIQRYLHSITTSKAAKSLRGRSFIVQLLTDGLARCIVRTMNLPPCNILFAGGGHFWIFAPDKRMKVLGDQIEELDLWLNEWSGGSLGFCIGQCTANGIDLAQKQMAIIWDQAMMDLHTNKSRRLRRLGKANRNRIFGVRPVLPTSRPCESCGTDVERFEPDVERTCDPCSQAINLGGALPRAVFLTRGSRRYYQHANAFSKGGRGSVWFGGPLQAGYRLSTQCPESSSMDRSDLAVYHLGTSLAPLPPMQNAPLGIWPVAHNAPLKGIESADPVPVTYDEMAAGSAGMPRLGVLRADVDNLGSIFRQGFTREESSISRLASLSWHLTLFFSGYLGSLIESESALSNSVQVVFSGGDDLFIVGAWDRLPALAARIRVELCEFAAGNPSITISAGIAVGGPNDPVSRLAVDAADAEDRAKYFSHRVNGGRTKKDAICILGRTLAWSELSVAAALARDLSVLVRGESAGYFDGFGLPVPPHIHEGKAALPRGLLQQLLSVAELEHESRKPERAASIEDVLKGAEMGRWAWLLAYGLVRMAQRHPRARDYILDLRESLATSQYRSLKSERQIIEYLEVAAAWAFMVTRRRPQELSKGGES